MVYGHKKQKFANLEEQCQLSKSRGGGRGRRSLLVMAMCLVLQKFSTDLFFDNRYHLWPLIYRLHVQFNESWGSASLATGVRRPGLFDHYMLAIILENVE